MATMVAGYFDNIVKDADGNILSRDWHPQMIDVLDKNGEKTGEMVMTCQVPIEGQHNNGLGVDFYIKKGYMPLFEAERKLDEMGIKYDKAARPAAIAAPVIAQPEAPKPKDQNILKPKRIKTPKV
jgi:hypothetical protein